MILFELIIGHALGDYVLQPDAMAVGKSHKFKSPILPWGYWLTAHALVHAGIVLMITGDHIIAAAEFVSHWTIDFLKCDGAYGIHVDQILHILCKVIWWVVLMTNG